MLASGASAFRVQDGMERLARAVGIERLHVQMTYTTITATAWANGTFRTEVVEQRNLGVNADRIDRFNAYVQSLPASLLVEDAVRDIEKIHGRPVLYSIPVSSVASGLACAGFAFLNKGGLVECLAVLVAALVGLGFSERDAESAFSQAEKAVPEAEVPELLRASLKILGAGG